VVDVLYGAQYREVVAIRTGGERGMMTVSGVEESCEKRYKPLK